MKLDFIFLYARNGHKYSLLILNELNHIVVKSARDRSFLSMKMGSIAGHIAIKMCKLCCYSISDDYRNKMQGRYQNYKSF